MWAVAEISEKIMKYSSLLNRNSDTKTFSNVELPDRFFQKQPMSFTNAKTYLPSEFLSNIFQTNITTSNVRFLRKLV
jgi:hypothetical protein